MKNIKVGQREFGKDKLFLIAGPCVIEKESIMMETAEKLKKIAERLDLPFIFKSSYVKDNRSSLEYYHGPGLEEGLKMLEKVKNAFDVPVISDVHQEAEVNAAAEVLDVIQIPAYLCMQTSLVSAAAKTGKAINVKHGQFLAPENMIKPVQKIEHFGNQNIMVTERGYTFGYNDLIVDPRSFYELQQTGYPVVFDITHCIRRYGIPSSDPNGGTRQYLGPIARAGVAAGIDGIFIEAHPDCTNALCDAASQYPLDQLEEFLKPLIEIHHIEKKNRTEI
ncbi:3-deoxy-8-phosphooctulonate synthase [Saccharicrinis fermentans]|uniref:3-deoxy-8-phosphooctulonate synthase n=1 Tax=Saccharicrinis fermentans DSM 9555 = JCM 21142 TaxID=869213 RepID=W7XWD8_9BACT|nr:3-deoxy-8-phosphooctulonate synthase [Saccharicrinis fermentans]GAF02590.1 2-dehydro-3-deoxyphosphooctonate aldolase [Saccharicrinis fermentans DSM 9555 = JCM 21142]